MGWDHGVWILHLKVEELLEAKFAAVLPTPEASLPGEIWVRGDSRVDLELGKW